MTNINFPAVRQAVYALVVGVLGAAVALGWLSPDHETAIIEAVSSGLAAVALLLAAANVNTGSKPTPAPEAPDDSLPVYDGPTSAPEYVGRHRLES